MTWTHLIGFGEAMIRLTSPNGLPLPAARQLDVSIGGAELNALIAARLRDMPAMWVSALPDGPLTDLVARQVAASRVDLLSAASAGTRVGLYFLESAAAPRPSRVTYDRAASAFALLDPASLSWTDLLRADSCLLLSGITPALGDGPRAALRDAVAAARAVGAVVAFDVNFRPSLWSAEECFGLLARIVPDVDVLSASEHDLRALGIDDDDPYAAALHKFDLRAVIGTTKHYQGPVVDIEVTATDRHAQVRRRTSTTVVDAVGAGDALFGTFLAALPTDGLERATSVALGAAVTAYGTHGDLMVTPGLDLDGPLGGVRR